MTTRFWRGSMPSISVSNCATRRFSASPDTWPRLGAIEFDLVDEDDRRRRLGGFLEQFAQLLLALAIGRAHDLGAGDVEEFRLAFVGDGARQAGLAGPGRAVEQHALGRIDAEALEQLGMAQRQLDHLAQRVDGVLHAAEVVIGDVGAALALGLLAIFGQQFDHRIVVDVDDPARRRRHHRQAHFLQREGGGVEQLADMLGHVGIDALVAGGGDGVALGERAALEAALERLGRALQADIVRGGGEHDPRRGLRLGLAHFDEIARSDPGIGALEAVEADDVEPFVVAIGADRARRGRALADDLDHVALGQAHLGHQLDRQARDPAPAVGRGQVGDLHPAHHRLGIRHLSPLSRCPACPRLANGGGAFAVQCGMATRQKKGRTLPSGPKVEERLPRKA